MTLPLGNFSGTSTTEKVWPVDESVSKIGWTAGMGVRREERPTRVVAVSWGVEEGTEMEVPETKETRVPSRRMVGAARRKSFEPVQWKNRNGEGVRTVATRLRSALLESRPSDDEVALVGDGVDTVSGDVL
jgi:hypothetical protein